MDFYFWGDLNVEVYKMVKIYFDNNWVLKEYEGEYFIGDQKFVRFIRMVIFIGNFQLVKWLCRVLLLSGKFCLRRDRVKCLFYGKIVLRDEIGIFINCVGVEESSISICVSDELN